MTRQPIERDKIKVTIVNIAGKGWGSDSALPYEEAIAVLGTLGDYTLDETDPKDPHWKVTLHEPLMTWPKYDQYKDEIVARKDRSLSVGDVGNWGTLWVDMEKVSRVLGK